MNVRAVDARRVRSGTWRTVVPTALVLLMIAALVLLPFVHARSMRPVHELMHQVAEPARGEVTKLHMALALQGSSVSDYIETRDSTTVQRYRTARQQEREATARLSPLTERLGTTVRSRFLEMAFSQEEWHHAVERGIAAASAGNARQSSPLDGDEYEELLLAAARLDEAIGTEVQRTQAGILAAERRQRAISLSLAVLGFAGAGVVAWLAWRLQLHAATLEEQRAALERATESRARLLRGLSHDLKNPMHAIDGHAQLLEDHILGQLQPAQQDSVARIRRGVRTMLALVEDLLELSRAEAGQLPVTPRPIEVAVLLDETVDEHHGAARTAGHRLELTIVDTAPTTIVTDPERVRQVLGNLLSNAVKYTPAGGRILVRAERRVRPGTAPTSAWLAVDVVDTGPGIPGDQVETIFDEFSRLAVHASKPGSGLGLAIARRVAGLLGGGLTVRSEPPGGACFTLWLPIGARA